MWRGTTTRADGSHGTLASPHGWLFEAYDATWKCREELESIQKLCGEERAEDLVGELIASMRAIERKAKRFCSTYQEASNDNTSD